MYLHLKIIGIYETLQGRNKRRKREKQYCRQCYFAVDRTTWKNVAEGQISLTCQRPFPP